ncbi:MAG: ABC transporter permease subunit [Pseudomonadota bacterium]
MISKTIKIRQRDAGLCLKASSLWSLLFWVLFLGTILPVVGVLIWSSFSFSIAADFYSPLLSTASETFLLLLYTLFFASLWAIPVAYICAFYKFKGSKLWPYLFVFPIAIPSYLNSFVFSEIFYYSGFIGTYYKSLTGDDIPFNIHSIFGAALVLSLSLFPYLFLPLYVRWKNFPKDLNAFLHLEGISHYQRLRKHILPMGMPIIYFGLSLIAMETLADFGTTSFLGVNSLSVFLFNIWQQTIETSLIISVAMIFMTLMICIRSLQSWNKKYNLISERGKSSHEAHHPTKTRPLLSLLSTAFFCVIFTLSFALPVGYFLYHTLSQEHIYIVKSLTVLWNTAFPAFTASFFAVIISLFFSFHQKLKNRKYLDVLIHVSTMGYAIPGIVIGIIVLIVFNAIDHFLIDVFVLPAMAYLSGGFFALIFAYYLRFLTVAYNNIHASGLQVSIILHEFSSLHSIKPKIFIQEVIVPIMKTPVAIGFVLVFIDIIKELPMTFILRPFGFESLATFTYNMAGLEQIAEASPSALLIIGFGLIACIMPFRLLKKYNP